MKKMTPFNLGLVIDFDQAFLMITPSCSVSVSIDDLLARQVTSMIEALNPTASHEIRSKSKIEWPVEALEAIFLDRFRPVELNTELVVRRDSFFWELTHPRVGRIRTTPVSASLLPSKFGLELPGSNVERNRRLDAFNSLWVILQTACYNESDEIVELRKIVNGLVERVGYRQLVDLIREFQGELFSSDSFVYRDDALELREYEKLTSILAEYYGRELLTEDAA